MRLIIAEKPSLARAIAEALPGRSSKRDGYIDAGDTRVTWCIGHLLEQAPPDDYDERFKRWSLDHLPIIPEQWKLKPRSQARGQLKIIRDMDWCPQPAEGAVVTVGAYDGVHRGHRAVIAELQRMAVERNAVTAVVTFDRHPASVVRPAVPPRRKPRACMSAAAQARSPIR